MTADRDDLAAIFDKHPATLERNRADDHLWQCLCGQIMGLSDSPLDARHRAHVAEVVAGSDWLRGVRAKELRDAADAYERDALAAPTYVKWWLRDRADRGRLTQDDA